MRGRAFLAALVIGCWCVAARAELVVNAPQPISRRVTVQLIQTALDNGTSPASVFGNATQRADIEAGIDLIWAQAGIDVLFLPGVTRWNDTFAYRGNAGAGERPGDDLDDIIDKADAENILHSDALVLDMFFVDVVPRFTPLDDNYAAGLARLGDNGIAAFAGPDLLTWGDGRDLIASVMAHEIGHNLGLNHTASGQMNLMSPSGSTEHLNTSQISAARGSRFARMIAAQLAGDYNDDGTVDAADYTVWRNTFGSRGANLAADGNNSGVIDQGDYTIWMSNYGADGNPGTGALSAFPAGTMPVPEPNMIVCAAAAVLSFATIRRKRE